MSDGYVLAYTPTTTYITIPSNTGGGTTIIQPSAGGNGYTIVGGTGQYYTGQQVPLQYNPSMQQTTLTGDLSGRYTPITIAQKSSGCSCKKCNDFNEYAEANQDDGTFICFGCRRGY